jgi:hypothetical protein
MISNQINRTEKGPMIEKYYGGIERDKKNHHQLNCGCICKCNCGGGLSENIGMTNSAMYSDPTLIIIQPIN